MPFPPDVPDPEGARLRLERLLHASSRPEEVVARVRARGHEAWRLLGWALGGSPFVAEQLIRHPERIEALTDRHALARARRRGDIADEARAALELEQPEGALDVLRRVRRREASRLALRDLCRLASVEETLAGLSTLADALVPCALEAAARAVRAEAGLRARPRGATEPGFAVLALGKLGGSELNFSSDVDLVYVHASDRGSVSHRPGAPHRHAYAEALGRRLTAVLGEHTHEGHVYRVDLRLRPEGSAGSLSHSLDSADTYYRTRGAAWERLALLKARPVAGDVALARTLLRRAGGFVWRRPFAGEELRQVLAMKAASDRSLAARGLSARHVKLGRGGIREIELIVQVLQLRTGGPSAALRARGSLEAIDALRAARVLPAAEAAVLASAYLFLRDVENKLQMAHDTQTHVLPADEAGLSLLASRMGYTNESGGAWSQLERDLERHRNAVHGLFKEIPPRAFGHAAR